MECSQPSILHQALFQIQNSLGQNDSTNPYNMATVAVCVFMRKCWYVVVVCISGSQAEFLPRVTRDGGSLKPMTLVRPGGHFDDLKYLSSSFNDINVTEAILLLIFKRSSGKYIMVQMCCYI